MPDADTRLEPNTNNQTSESPPAERPVPEKTESTAKEETKTQDVADGKAKASSSDPAEDEEPFDFDEWVQSFTADPDAAWEQMQLKFEALMATESDGYMAQDIQEDEEDTEAADEAPATSRAPGDASRQAPKKTSRNTNKTASAVNASRRV